MQKKMGYVPLPPSDDEIRRIVTSNGYGDNRCCSERTNCFLEKLSLSEAVKLVSRYTEYDLYVIAFNFRLYTI